MPRRVQLPNGRWIYIPDINPYMEQLRLGRPPITGLPLGLEEEEDEGTLAGSAWEGFKSIPSGVADIFYSGLQAAIGVATPFADLPVEQRLRRAASKRARERDPAYQDAFLPAVGTGLGQVAGLSAISRLPYGWPAAMAAGVGMGISEQTRRIADYEQRTGTNVPWYKESSAHMMGALIGLTEVLPIKFGLFPTSVSKMVGRMKSGLSPNAFRNISKLERTFGFGGALAMGLEEGTQEASANLLQALSARGLYDPNAMKDIARSMAEDFKVGGVVGGIAKLVTHQILGKKARGVDIRRSLDARLRDRRYRTDQAVKDVHGNITGIAEELPKTLRDLGIGRELGLDITNLFGGLSAAIPGGMDQILRSGQISRSDVQQLVKEFEASNARAKNELDRLIKHHTDAGNNAEVVKYVKAKTAIDEMATKRIEGLSRTVVELGGGLGEIGGLSGNLQYQEARQAAIEADESVSVRDTHKARRDVTVEEKPSYFAPIQSLMGGSYGMGGWYKMAELLGVHRGPGSKKVNLEIPNENLTYPDSELSSSDRANFDMAEVGAILFEDDKSSLPPELVELEIREEEIEQANDDLFKGRAFSRELSEILRKKKYDNEAEWLRERNNTELNLARQRQKNDLEISRINREKNVYYSFLLRDKLQSAVGLDREAKRNAAIRIFGKPDVERFDAWLNDTIKMVERSADNGRKMRDEAEAERIKFGKNLAAQVDAPDAEKEVAEAEFISVNIRRFIEFPRDISVPQLTRIANLFISDPKDPKDALQGALAVRAYADISKWKIDDALFEVAPGGTPVPNPTTKVVNKFVDELGELFTDESGNTSLEDGRPEDISADDIVKLLRSKNIHLRNENRIGKTLAERTGTGVESRPFEKLLFDMTGAPSWDGATYAQRLFMYSRLLQLPAHYKSRGSPEEQLFLQKMGAKEWDYRPLMLPDFYDDPNIDSHIDFMTDRVIEVTDEGDQVYPSLTIGQLRNLTATELGDNFNGDSFDEALARLIETGVFKPTDSLAPTEIISPEDYASLLPEAKTVDLLEEDQVTMALGDRIVEVPTRSAWVKLLNDYGIEGKNPQFPWGTIPDAQRPDDLTDEEWLGEKWTPVIKSIFPEVSGDVDVEFIKADDERLRTVNDDGTPGVLGIAAYSSSQGKIFISHDRVQKLAKLAISKERISVADRQAVGLASINKYLNYVKDINKGFLDADEVMLLVLAHEMAHEKFTPQEAGVSIRPDWKGVAAGITMLSGGAKGSDTLWGKIGLGYGLLSDNIKHLHAPQHRKSTLPSMNTEVSDELLAEADVHLRKAATALGKKFSGGTGYVADLLRRSWLQVKYADQIFAIGTWDKKRPGAVEGGTGWGVQMAIDNNKQVFFFDQNKGQWHTVDKGNWTRISIPTIETSRFAGIGTRQINAAGRKAIEDVYNKTEKEKGESESYGAYENQINEMGLRELNRYMTSQAKRLYIEQRRKGRDRLPDELSDSRVRFNVNYIPVETPWAIMEGLERITQPGDTRVRDEEYWVEESDPKLTHKLLTEPQYDERIDDLLIAHNEKHPDKQLNKEEFIKTFAPWITSALSVQELSDLGILGTVQGAVAVRDRMAPTESIIDLGTPEGRRLVQSLMKDGALPSSLQDNVQALRKRFLKTMTTRFETLHRNVEELVQGLKLPDNVQLLYVDDVDGLFQFLGDVVIRGEEMTDDIQAMYDRPGNRIIINLAAIDPNDMMSAQEVVREAAFHEGLHALFIRDHLTAEELDVLLNFVRNAENIVPKEIDEKAHNAGLTWFERSVIDFSDSDLSEADIEQESMISLLENIVRNPDALEKGKKVRKVGKGIRGFLEGFVDAAKDADIVDVMKILGRIESGEVGDRGAGFLGDEKYTSDSIIRSNTLLRYANPEDIEQLKRATALLESAPSDQMRESEQAKVDDIVDKIVTNRGIIRESAGPSPDAIKAIENQRKLIQDMRDTHTGAVALIGLDQSKKNSEEYKLALDTFMEMRGKDPDLAYKMPAPYQTFLNNRPKSSWFAREIVKSFVERGVIGETPKDSTRESIKSGALSGVTRLIGKDGKPKELTGDDVEGTLENVNGWVSQMRYQYLDRRQWIVAQTDRLIAAQNRAQLDAETSALVMWRNADNALNWLPSLMLRGPLSYLGKAVGAGRFDNAPVYDSDLQEKHGGDGRVQGLNDILGLISNADDSDAAHIYGIAKRVQWTKARLDGIKSVTEGIARENLAPELRRELEIFEQAYEDIRESVSNLGRTKEEVEFRLDELIGTVEEDADNKFIIEFWDRYNAYDNHMIKMSYNTGMITREQRDEWLSMPYTPFYRDSDSVEKFPVGSQSEIAQRGINLVEKSLQASRKPIERDLANGIIENTQALVRDALMNVAVSRTARDAVSLGDAEKISISGMAASVDNRVIRVMEDGIPVFYQLRDAQLAMSVMMLGTNPKKQLQEMFGGKKIGRGIQKVLTGASTLLRETVTKTPPFAIKNVFRDSWTAMNLTGGGPLLVIEAFRNALNVDVLRRSDELGLSIGIDFIAEPGEYGNKMRSELKKANLDWKNPLSPFVALWNGVGRIAKRSEVATRVAVYDRILAKTGDKALAQHYAIEIMNYGRRGASPMFSTYMATVPFMNGRLQGADVTYRGLRSKKGSSDVPGIYGYGLTADELNNLPWWQKNRQQIFGRGMMLMGATFILYMLMRDDDEWQDLREETKADNWVLPLSDHAWLKIPIPFEVGVLFKVIPEKIFAAILEKDVGAVDVGDEVWRQLENSLSLGGPQLFTPIVNAMRNYDTFRKDAIVDPWMEETMSPNEQRNRYTSNIARGVADLVDSIPLVKNLDFLTSPMKVEYMMRQYLGTAGSYMVTLADRLARTGIMPDIPFDPYMNIAKAESVIGTNKDFDWKSLIGGEGIANVPMLGDLLTDPRTRGGRQQQFFGIIEKLDMILATLNSITERDYKKGFEYKRKHMAIYRHRNQLNFLRNQMSKWRERRDHIAKVPRGSMSEDQERAYYERLLATRQSILASVDDLMASIKQG